MVLSKSKNLIFSFVLSFLSLNLFSQTQTTSPPVEYFSTNMIYLDQFLVQVGHDHINQNYVILPSPNIVNIEHLGNGKKKVTLQFYFDETEEILTDKYKIDVLDIHYLYVKTARIYDQGGNILWSPFIPEGVSYRVQKRLSLIVSEEVENLSFFYTFVGRSGWSEMGISSEIKSIIKRLKEVDISSNGKIHVQVNDEEGLEAYEVYSGQENSVLNDVFEQLQSVTVWGELADDYDLVKEITHLQDYQVIDVDLNNFIEDMEKYPELFGVPPKNEWKSMLSKLSKEKLTEEEFEKSDNLSGNVGYGGFSLGGNHSSSQKKRFKDFFKFELEGNVYIPKAMNFVIRKKDSIRLLKRLLFKVHKNIEVGEYHFGLGLSLSEENRGNRLVEVTETLFDSEYANSFHEGFSYHCTGDKFFTGLQSYHNSSYEDRRFKMQCGQLNLVSQGYRPQKEIVKKTSCYQSGNIHSYDQRGQFDCREGMAISGVSSLYSSQHRDRVYQFECCEAQTEEGNSLNMIDCDESSWVNNYDDAFNFQCPSGKVMTGVTSVHSNRHEDRVFLFRCCRPQP